jgi:hypothetical protein
LLGEEAMSGIEEAVIQKHEMSCVKISVEGHNRGQMNYENSAVNMLTGEMAVKLQPPEWPTCVQTNSTMVITEETAMRIVHLADNAGLASVYGCSKFDDAVH